MSVDVVKAEHEALVRPYVDDLFVMAPDDFRRLCDEDTVIQQLNRSLPGVRTVRQHDLLTALVRSVSAQQINLRWASTIRARLAQNYGRRHDISDGFAYSLDAHRLAAAAPSDIRELQFTVRKAESIIALAAEVESGRLSLARLASLSSPEVIACLVTFKGIGVWSAEWLLARTLGRPVVVAGDLGVRKAVGRAYLDGAMPSEEDVRRITNHWGASANVAQALVLHGLATGST